MRLKKLLCLGLLTAAMGSQVYMPVSAAVDGDCSDTTTYVPTEEDEILNELKMEGCDDEEDTSSTMKTNLGLTIYQQENSYYCGPATCKMVLKEFGVTKTQSVLASALGTTTDGTVFNNIPGVLNTYQSSCNYVYRQISTSSSGLYGYDYDSWKTSVRADISNGNPIVIDIKVTSSTQDTYDWDYTTNGHYLAVSGYDNESSSTTPYVWIADPHPTYCGTYYKPAKYVFGANMTHSRHAITW